MASQQSMTSNESVGQRQRTNDIDDGFRSGKTIDAILAEIN